jgi:hypothetical protein
VAAAHGEAERWRVELTGKDAPAEIGLRLLAGEHEWGLGKAARGSVEAMGEPIATAHGDQYFTGGEERAAEANGARGVHGKGKEMQTMSLCSPGQVEQKRREEEVGMGSERGDDVAGGGRLGTSWRVQGRAARKGTEPGLGRTTRGRKGSRRWTAAACIAAVGGAAPAAEHGRQGNRGGSGEEEGGKRSEGPMCKTKGSQGSLGKLIFPTDVEI